MTDVPVRLSLRDRLVPLVVAGTFFMQMMDSSILNTSLPQMARTFAVRPLDLSTGVTVYMLVFAAMPLRFMPAMIAQLDPVDFANL